MHKIDTIHSFYETLDRKRKRIGISDFPVWYRGHSRRDFRLLPTLFRIESDLNREINIYDIFVRETAGLVDRSLNSWEILSVMRHYGCPTRMLDWSDSLHVAIFFAICWDPAPHEPTIWLLNPFSLNHKSIEQRVIISDPNELGFQYTNCLHEKTWPSELPIAITPQWVTPRHKAQRGYFTVHGTNHAPIENIVPGCIEKVVIPEHLIGPLKEELKRSRSDCRSLFPGLEGVGLFMQREFSSFY